MRGPTAKFETEFGARGYVRIAGVDEVGRGCLAGPVVAAAVVFDLKCVPDGLDDSKRLSPAQRERLDVIIRQCAVAWGIGIGSVEEIDSLNILQASRLAMLRAVEAITPCPDCLLLDGNGRIDWSGTQHPIVKGDQLSVSIAAASILAKVYRDAMMREMDALYPGYGFAEHKGYGSPSHRRSLQSLGLTPIHRRTFSWTPV